MSKSARDYQLREYGRRIGRGQRGGKHCSCGGCHFVKHIVIPYHGEPVVSGVEHHVGRHLFIKRDRLGVRPCDATTHEMCDDELLAHFSVYDPGSFADSSDKIPTPMRVPLVEFPRERAATDAATLQRASKLAEAADIGPLETLVYFPHHVSKLGECIRYGDVCLAAQQSKAGDLQPLLLLVKASLPVVGVSVCMLLNVPGATQELIVDANPSAGEVRVGPLDTLIVPDEAIIVMSRGANWHITRQQAAMREAGICGSDFERSALEHGVCAPMPQLEALPEAAVAA